MRLKPLRPNETGAARAKAGVETPSNLPWAYLRLPPFPQVAVRVLQLVTNENVQLHELCELVSSDAVFASEVLTVANSALFAPRYPATSILQAIAVLGADKLQGMCVTVGVRAYLGKSMTMPAMRGLWRHSLACGLIAQKLASGGLEDEYTSYTAGVLHDIGRIALTVVQPKDYAALLESHSGPADSIRECERALFGWDHCDAGQRLVASWRLPVEFEEIVLDHHSPRRTDGAWGLAELVKMSCAIADSAGYAAFAGCESAVYGELLERLPARERRLFYPDVEQLTQDVAAGIRAIESV
ncbi:MAG TPA: HDOD domain-containing protein [Terracidiphilus sp.]|nr:HDOD domain-containing protein [Terracidiphilus sp.]